jgi:hypothetical protein
LFVFVVVLYHQFTRWQFLLVRRVVRDLVAVTTATRLPTCDTDIERFRNSVVFDVFRSDKLVTFSGGGDETTCNINISYSTTVGSANER